METAGVARSTIQVGGYRGLLLGPISETVVLIVEIEAVWGRYVWAKAKIQKELA